ncbi:MAG: hypothetical protein WA908_02920 [Pontixanthobacter sp.]
MSDGIYIAWAIGALILAAGALTGYRMNWRKGLVYVMIWGSIFAAATLLIDAVMGW